MRPWLRRRQGTPCSRLRATTGGLLRRYVYGGIRSSALTSMGCSIPFLTSFLSVRCYGTSGIRWPLGPGHGMRARKSDSPRNRIPPQWGTRRSFSRKRGRTRGLGAFCLCRLTTQRWKRGVVGRESLRLRGEGSQSWPPIGPSSLRGGS